MSYLCITAAIPAYIVFALMYNCGSSGGLTAFGMQVAVCTPGRMIDLIKMKACNMLRVTYLVFDEADRMFDMGFEPQVSVNNMPQTCMQGNYFVYHL